MSSHLLLLSQANNSNDPVNWVITAGSRLSLHTLLLTVILGITWKDIQTKFIIDVIMNDDCLIDVHDEDYNRGS